MLHRIGKRQGTQPLHSRAASYPYHNHPGGEELFVLKGSCIIEDTLFNQGDYLYTPLNFRHSVRTKTGCEILFIVPEELQIIR